MNCNLNFVKTSDSLPSELPVYLVIGRSNVGKSSFINFLNNKNIIARQSKKPGRTNMLNLYFDKVNEFYIVDTPGYGYSSQSKKVELLNKKIMESILVDGQNIKQIFFLIDSRHPFLANDLLVIEYLQAFIYPIVFIFTKCDKLKQKEKYQLMQKIKSNLKMQEFYLHSDKLNVSKTSYLAIETNNVKYNNINSN